MPQWIAFCLALRAASPVEEPRWQLHLAWGRYGMGQHVYVTANPLLGTMGGGTAWMPDAPPLGPMRSFLLSCR